MIKLIKSTYYQEKRTTKRLTAFLKRAKHLSFGSECEKFEDNFAKWQGRKYCVMVNSGSSANLALFQALLNLDLIKKNNSVGFSAVTWSTNTMPIIQLGLKPVPVDVEVDTLNVSSRTLQETINKYPLKILFLTNLLGFCDDLEKIVDICREKNILLVEDNCESLGTVYQKQKLGNFGLASTFSFYVGHHLSTVEGGAVCTDDKNLAIMLKLVRAHGWDRNLDFCNQNELRKKFKINSTFYSRYTFYDLGYNFRPTEIAGFLGNVGLETINQVVKKRERNFLRIAKKIYSCTEKYYPIKFGHLETVSNFAVPVICKSIAIRNKLVRQCAGKIEIRPVVAGNITKQPFYDKYVKGPFPKTENADLIHQQGLYFGNNPELTTPEIETIINKFSR